MEDLAGEFQEDFRDAVKVLEDFSASDGGLREALKRIRTRVDGKAYTCAPNFWEDLRLSLGTVEQNRDESAAKSKAKQVMKQIARLEVKFWAKESTGMLRDLDPESRLERMIDWIQTFEGNQEAGDPSGPAVLYQVLNDPSIQKDMEAPQRDMLTWAVRENLSKFPVSMQAMLERVGTVIGGGSRGVQDWRRRNLAAPQQQEPQQGPGAAMLRFNPPTTAAAAEQSGVVIEPWAEAAVATLAAAAALDESQVQSGAYGTIGSSPAEMTTTTSRTQDSATAAIEARSATDLGDLSGGIAAIGAVVAGAEEEENDETAAIAPASTVGDKAVSHDTGGQVDPELLQRARRAVLAMLASNSGECKRSHVKNLFKQIGVGGLTMAALGDEIFHSGTDVFLSRIGAVRAPAVPPPGKQPLTDELRQRMVDLVRESSGRLPLTALSERLQWQTGSFRHETHGPLRRVVQQVPELIFEPEKVFSIDVARTLILGLKSEAPAEDPNVTSASQILQSSAAAYYISDPFSELLSTILTWLQQADGVLDQSAVLPLIKAMGFKISAVIKALATEVFWSHQEAECEIMLRTSSGAAKHPKPLPDVYLHKQVHQNIVQQIKTMGAKAKMSKLAGALGWNAKSELRITYGTLRIVLMGVKEVFFDPHHLYLKRNLDNLVEWPVKGEGRLGPQAVNDDSLRRWTPQVDDMKSAGDPIWSNAKRQIIGTLMRLGGRCDVVVIRQLLAAQLQQGQSESESLPEIQLESLFDPNSKRDLSSVLFWGHSAVRCRRPEHIERIAEADNQVVPEVSKVLIETVKAKGTASLTELQAALQNAGLGVEEELDAQSALLGVLPRIPELFYMPQLIFMKYVVDSFTYADPAAQTVTEGAADAVPAAGLEGEEMDSTAEVGDADVNRATPKIGTEALLALPTTAAEMPAAAPKVPTMQNVARDSQASSNFFSFTEFTAQAAKKKHELEADEFLAELHEAKRPRVDQRGGGGGGSDGDGRGSVASNVASADVVEAWADTPPWLVDGAGVLIQDGHSVGVEGTILSAGKASCVVRITSSGVQRDVATPQLLPMTPKVGATVKVVAGDRAGCHGTLVGLAGAEAVVQFPMFAVTVPMRELAVLGV